MKECREGITTSGKVVEVKGKRAVVQTMAYSACGSCPARKLCGMESAEARFIDVENIDLKEGEEVFVEISSRQGWLAVLLGYGIPFFVLIVFLLVTWRLTGKEALSGLVSLGAVFVYYGSLYFFRRGLRRKLEVKVKKINN